MAQTLVTPDGVDWPHLSAEPNLAERRVADWFRERFIRGDDLQGWAIYERPYINGIVPSLVLVHPQRGIAVYEVVDWEPGSVGLSEGTVLSFDGQPLEGVQNPFLLVRHYKNVVARFATDVIGKAGYGMTTAGVIFTRGSNAEWRKLGDHFRRDGDSRKLYPVLGPEFLGQRKIQDVLPSAIHPSSLWSRPEVVARLLCAQLEPPSAPSRDADPFVLDGVQSVLVDSDPGLTGYRRVKGPAGSGKSLILAHRAAVLAGRRYRVLIVCFNITLTSYLKELVHRKLFEMEGGARRIETLWRNIEVHHYHEWVKDHEWMMAHPCDCLDAGVCGCREENKFDAIMVDEGQDFHPQWWNHLRLCALRHRGEVLFAADATQDIYGQSKAWTDETMRSAGFRGAWNTLPYSYRVPVPMVPMLRDYVSRFLRDRVADLPTVAQGGLGDLYPVSLRWVQHGKGDLPLDVLRCEIQRVCDGLPSAHRLSDIVVLFPSHSVGFSILKNCVPRSPEDVATILVGGCGDTPGCCDRRDSGNRYDRSECVQRRSRSWKLGFPSPREGLRAVTVHSYKGWESKHVVIFVQDVSSGEGQWDGAALFYVALTRLMRDQHGSSLTVVSSCEELGEFGRTHFSDYETVGSM